MHLILKHLIENALKSAKNSGKTSIAMTPKNNEVRFSVADDRVGIDEELQEGLFNLDNTNSTAGTDRELGAGIGLKIYKTLVKKHNGAI